MLSEVPYRQVNATCTIVKLDVNLLPFLSASITHLFVIDANIHLQSITAAITSYHERPTYSTLLTPSMYIMVYYMLQQRQIHNSP